MLFCDILPILAKNWLPSQCPLEPCNQKCLLRIDRPRKPPVISNHILATFCRNSFICIYSNFSTKIGCRGNTPLLLKLWPILWFWPILAKIWLPWQRPLDPCNQKCLLWIGRSRKPPVISNHILAISHRNAFMTILVPKLVAMVTPLCPMCKGVSQMNSRIAQTVSQNQTLHRYIAYNWRYGHFCDILAYFGQKIGCHGNVP